MHALLFEDTLSFFFFTPLTCDFHLLVHACFMRGDIVFNNIYNNNIQLSFL